MVRTGPLTAFSERFAPAGFAPGAFTASYGMAEATLALTMAPLGEGLREETGPPRPGRPSARPPRSFVACGPVLAGHELQVRGDDGRSLPERTVGRAFVRGPSLMRGYFRRPEATAAVLDAEGWLDTGDLGFLADGQFVPTGRAKDLILYNGRNIWPQDLEWTAEAEVAGLRSGDVAAFPLEVDDAPDGEGVVTLVQTRTPRPGRPRPPGRGGGRRAEEPPRRGDAGAPGGAEHPAAHLVRQAAPRPGARDVPVRRLRPPGLRWAAPAPSR